MADPMGDWPVPLSELRQAALNQMLMPIRQRMGDVAVEIIDTLFAPCPTCAEPTVMVDLSGFPNAPTGPTRMAPAASDGPQVALVPHRCA